VLVLWSVCDGRKYLTSSVKTGLCDSVSKHLQTLHLQIFVLRDLFACDVSSVIVDGSYGLSLCSQFQDNYIPVRVSLFLNSSAVDPGKFSG